MFISKAELGVRIHIIRKIEESLFYDKLKLEFDRILGIEGYKIQSKFISGFLGYEEVIELGIKSIAEDFRQSIRKTIRGKGVKFVKGEKLGKAHKISLLKIIDDIQKETFSKWGLMYSEVEIVDGVVYMGDRVGYVENEKFKNFELKANNIVKTTVLNKKQLDYYHRYIYIRDYFDKKYNDIYFIFVGWYKKKMKIELYKISKQPNKLNEFLLTDFIEFIVRKDIDVKEWDLIVKGLWDKQYPYLRFIQNNISWKRYIDKNEGDLFKEYYKKLNMEEDIGFLFKNVKDRYVFDDFKKYCLMVLDSISYVH